MWSELTPKRAGGSPSLLAPPLFVLINPGSGQHDGASTREALARIFGEAGRACHFIQAPAGALEDAAQRAASQAATRSGVLVAVGGDGTINAAAAAALRAGCPLGVLPQGTFNYFGRVHGIPQDLEAAARALLRAQPEAVQVGEVNGKPFLVNASLGLYPQLLQDREAFKQRFGRRRWVAVLAGLVTLFEWRRQLVLEIEEGGERRVVVTPTLFVGNNRLQLERTGIAQEVAAPVGQGCLAAVLARPIGSWAMLGLLLRGAFGRLGDADQVDSFPLRSLTVRMPGRKRAKLAADGEVGVAALPLQFRVAPVPLQLMLPVQEDRVPVE